MKHLPKILFLLLALILQSQPCHSQTAKAIFLIHPAEATVQIDHQTVPALGKWTTIQPGTHQVRITAKTYLPKDTVCVAQPADSLRFKASLTHYPAYIAYEHDARLYVGRKSLALLTYSAMPLVVAAGLAGNAVSRIRMDSLIQEANQWKTLYDNTIDLDEMAHDRTQYENVKAEYDKIYNRRLVRTIGCGVLLTGMTVIAVRSTIQILKSKKPHYTDPDEPALGLQLGLGSVSPYSLSINLQF